MTQTEETAFLRLTNAELTLGGGAHRLISINR
jgi:hypothetical protein